MDTEETTRLRIKCLELAIALHPHLTGRDLIIEAEIIFIWAHEVTTEMTAFLKTKTPQ